MDSKEQDFAQVRWEEKINEIYLQRTRLGSKIASKRLLRQWPPRRLRSHILNKLFGVLWLVSLLWNTMQLLAPVALIQQDLGICLDRVPAPQPLGPSGPIVLDHLMTTGIQDADFDISSGPADEHARSAVLLRFPCEQYHTGITKWINTLWERSNIPADNRPVTIHCEAGSTSVRLVFESRSKCQDFVVRYNDDGIPYESDSPFCRVKTTITVRQSKSIEDREMGKQFAPLWRDLSDQLAIVFPDRDDEGAFIVPVLDTRSQVLSIKDRRNGVGKPVFKLAPFGSGQLFALVAPDLCVPGVLLKCCRRSSLKPARPMCDGRPFASPLFRRLAGRGALFRGFPFRWVLHFVL